MKYLLIIGIILVVIVGLLFFWSMAQSAGRYGEFKTCNIKVTYLFYQDCNKDEFHWEKDYLHITAYRTAPPPPEIDGTLEVYRNNVTIVETKGGILWEDSSFL